MGAQGKLMEVAVGGAVGTELRPLGCRGLRGTRDSPGKGLLELCTSAHLGAQNRKAGKTEVTP